MVVLQTWSVWFTRMCFVALLVEEHLHYNIRYWRIENLLKGYSAYITLRSCWRVWEWPKL